MTNINDKYKSPLVENCKHPPFGVSQNDPKNWFISKKSGALLTGNYTMWNNKKVFHNNGVSLVDIDFLKKLSKKEQKSNIFLKTFGQNFVESFNTFTVLTQSKGFHLYFKYVDIPSCVSNQTREGEYVDFLNDRKYVVSTGHSYRNRKYKTFLDTSIKEMPSELYEYLKNILPKPKGNNTKKNKNPYTKKNTNCYINKFSYDMGDKLKHILKSIPDTYFNTYGDYLKFTSFCKAIGIKKQWDIISKTKSGYDLQNNEKIWNTCKPLEGIVDHFLKYSNIPKSYVKYKPVVEYMEHEPDIIINRRKLGLVDGKPEDIIENILKKYKNKVDCIVIKSDTGTGKTYSMSQWLKYKHSKFISIVSRVSLGQEQTEKCFNNDNNNGYNLECLFYKNHDGFFKTGDNVVIQLESLIRLSNVDVSDYTLYLDEFSSIIQHLITSDTLNQRRCLVYRIFCRLIQNCKLVVCTDADINSISLEFLKSLKSNIVFVKNTFSHNKNIVATELETFEEIVELIKKEKKFFCCCDSKSRAEKIHYLLNDKNVKLITSEEINYVNLNLYDKIIISPKIIYGLDCTIKKNVYCVYQCNTISPPQMIQQISRIRNINQLYFNFISKTVTAPLYNDVSECYRILKYSDRMSVKEFELICDEKTTNQYLNYLSKIEYTLDCYRTNKLYHFIRILIERGFILTKQYFKSQSINKKKEKEIVKEIFEQKVDNIEFYKSQVNKYLNIPDDRIDEYSDILIDKYKLLTHLNIKKHFFKFDLAQDIKLHIITNDNDFAVNISSGSNCKIYFLKTLLKACDANDVQPQKALNEADSKIFYDKYTTIFRSRTKNKLDFTKMRDINKTVSKIYKELFKDYVTVTKKGKYKKLLFTITKNNFDYHKTLFDFSIYSNNNDFIEEKEKEGVENHINTLKIYNKK